MQYLSLYGFQFFYFIMTGAYTFASKYFAEIGLTESQIGCIVSIPTIFALAFTPMLGMAADRIPKKRWMLSGLIVVMAAIYFLMDRFVAFPVLLILAITVSAFSNSVQPTFVTIGLEYTRAVQRPFGPIRMSGTVGYQIGALLVGWLLFQSLRGLFGLMAGVLLVAMAFTFFMPDVQGHQHAGKKVPLKDLFLDRHIAWLYLMLFFAAVTTQFYNAFFSKYLGDIGFDNGSISLIMAVSVAVEVPFLLFADRIYKKSNIWNWVLIGFVCNGIRWIGLAFARSVPIIILFQLPGITTLACFEFFPSLYLSRRASEKLANSAQSLHHLVIFGAGNLVGGLLGGVISERIGLGTTFICCGIMLMTLCAAFLPLTRRMIREERA